MFIEKRAQSFQHMWRWRIFVLRVKLERGLMPKQIFPRIINRQAEIKMQAGMSSMLTIHSMEDVM